MGSASRTRGRRNTEADTRPESLPWVRTKTTNITPSSTTNVLHLVHDERTCLQTTRQTPIWLEEVSVVSGPRHVEGQGPHPGSRSPCSVKSGDRRYKIHCSVYSPSHTGRSNSSERPSGCFVKIVEQSVWSECIPPTLHVRKFTCLPVTDR